MSRLRKLKDRAIGTSEQAASAVADAATGATDRLQEGAGSVAHRLQRAGESAAEKLHDVGETLQQTPRQVARATQGSPTGVGLIAFGSGMLAAALIPETETERRAVHQLSEHAGPIVAPLQEAGRAVAADIRDTVEAAGEQVCGWLRSRQRVMFSPWRPMAWPRCTAASGGASDVRTAVSGGVDDVRSAAEESPARGRRRP